MIISENFNYSAFFSFEKIREYLFLIIFVNFIFLVIAKMIISRRKSDKILSDFLERDTLFKVLCSHSLFWTYCFLNSEWISLRFNRRNLSHSFNESALRGNDTFFTPRQLLDNVSITLKSGRKTFKNVFLFENNINEFLIFYIPKESTFLCSFKVPKSNFFTGEIKYDPDFISPIVDMHKDKLFTLAKIISVFKILRGKHFKKEVSEMVVSILVSHLTFLRNIEIKKVEIECTSKVKKSWRYLTFDLFGFTHNLWERGFHESESESEEEDEINPRFASYYFLPKLKKLKFRGETFKEYILKKCSFKRVNHYDFSFGMPLKDDECFTIKR